MKGRVDTRPSFIRKGVIMSLNSAQIEAIAHKDGPCQVLSGPGSGKTTVITKRIECLIEKYKVKPEEILVITFSQTAAKEMKERFCAIRNGKASQVHFGTFHGVYFGILKWAYHLKTEQIFSEEQKYQLLQQVFEQLKIETDDEQDFLQEISWEIGNVKNNCFSLADYEPVHCEKSLFVKIYETYEAKRQKYRKIDFDDMLTLTLELFQKRSDILKLWQEKFHYILIDEFQDINQVQYDVIRLLAMPQNNLFVVGDDDQSIYGFRGSCPNIMLDFCKDYPDAKQIILNQNYRSTKSIVNGANRVISHNQNRYQKEIVTDNEQGADIWVQEVLDTAQESQFVVKKLQKLINQGVKAKEIAVLYRTNTAARMLVEACLEYDIPFVMKDKCTSLYNHFIAKDMIAYMRMALGDITRKDFLEVMNRPNRYISRECIDDEMVFFEKLKLYYDEKEWMVERIEQLEIDLQVIKKCAPYAAIQYIRKHVGYDNFLFEYARKRNMKPEKLFEVLEDILESTKAYSSLESWMKHVEEYKYNYEKQQAKIQNKKQGVSLMTMHSSKGLEFHSVFIVGANEDVIPYKRAQTEKEIEEERRLFYVAMTRAKKQLYISYVKDRNGKSMEESRFVRELMGSKS